MHRLLKSLYIRRVSAVYRSAIFRDVTFLKLYKSSLASLFLITSCSQKKSMFLSSHHLASEELPVLFQIFDP